MKKTGLILYIMLLMAMTAQGQNITDQAVMNDKAANKQEEQSDYSAMSDTMFLHPDRIRFDNRCMQIEGKDVFMFSGTMHYFRVAEPLWRDRLQKMKDMGCNTVETYVPWNWHEREMPASVDDFSKVDLTALDRFLTLAEGMGLYVIVRPGPYICAEWQGGGFPVWIMRKRPQTSRYDVWLQSDDPEFIKWSEHWYKAVARVVAPHQIYNRRPGTGGVILWQLENEYNRVKWFPREAKKHYLEQLAVISRQNGIEVPFITCWTNESRSCTTGPLAGCVDMVNSYPRWQIERGFGRLINQQLKTMPGKPLLSGELQGGWFSAIGGRLSQKQDGVAPVQTQNIALYALQRGFCGINFYMMVGGTNFDDWATREATATYDYYAAIGEDGSLNDRYDRLRNVAGIFQQHGTRIARARLADIKAETGDSLVEIALRKADNGDRYFFVRTEEHTRQHSGSATVDGLTFSYNLEPFGSQILYVPAGSNMGEWLPSNTKETLHRAAQTVTVQLEPIDETQDVTPRKWAPLKAGQHIDEVGIYGYHPVYYRLKAPRGARLEVGRIGDKIMKGTLADKVMLALDGHILQPDSSDKEKEVYLLPETGSKMADVVLLYLSPGLHHHTDKLVEQHWHTGPEWVRVNGKPAVLSYAYTEAGHGEELSQSAKKARQGDSPLMKWFRYKFKTNGKGLFHLHLEHTGDGFVYVNGHAIGRCWETGPQRDYYIPECWVNDGDNIVAVSLCRTGEKAPTVNNASIKIKGMAILYQ